MARLATHHTIGIRASIKRKRLSSGLTQRELAEKLGIESWNYISMLENGTTPIPIARAAQVADFVGLDPWVVIRAAMLEAVGDHLDSHLPAA